MDTMWRDFRYGLRSLRRGGLLIAIAILSLGIGIGSVTTIFSAVDVFMLRPLPFPESDRLLAVYTTNPERGWSQVWFSPPDFVDFRERSQTMEVASSTGAAFNLSEGDQPERIQGRRLSWNFLRVLGVEPTLGRGFLPEEETEGRGQVAIVSHGLWQRRFGADPAVQGATVLLDGEPYTVVGVMPPDFWYGSIFDDVWVPLAVTGTESRNSHYLLGVGRLKDGFTREQAHDEATRIAARLEAEYPETNAGNGRGRRACTTTSSTRASRSDRRSPCWRLSSCFSLPVPTWRTCCSPTLPAESARWRCGQPSVQARFGSRRST